MKIVSTTLAAHFGEDCTTLAVLWKVSRQDGTVMGFTTFDMDITYQANDDAKPILYEAATGAATTASESKSDLSVDNLEVTGFLDSSRIDEADIRAGVYDNALIEERVVNWADLTMGDMIVRVGYLGTVKMVNGLFTAELRGLTQKLSTSIGATYGPVCRAELGSSAANDTDGSWYLWYCNVDLASYQQPGSVSSSPDAMTVIPAAGLMEVGSSPSADAAAGWFDNGVVTFTSGALKGRSFEIKTWDGTALNMFLPLSVQPAAGDTFTITPGCDKTTGGSGCLKFGNIVNYRGEPFIPGADAVLNYPGAS